MCVVTESGTIGFRCGICQMSISMYSPCGSQWDRARGSGKVELECDPLVAKKRGRLVTICHGCAKKQFNGEELRRLSHPSLSGFRKDKLGRFCESYGEDKAEYCKVLTWRMKSSYRRVLVTV